MDEHQRLTELDGDDAASLAAAARRTEYYGRLELYLEEEYGEPVPTDDPRAFEREDGVRAVSFEAETVADADTGTDAGARPTVAVTIHFDGDSDGEEVVQASAERHGDAVDGDVELVFPTEIAPRPEAAVRDLLQPDRSGELEVAVTVDESDEITSYTIEI